jgi:adenine phosphoribosyltransferase
MIASLQRNQYVFTIRENERADMDLAKYIRDIPDFPKPGILFKDITPLLAEPRAFQHAIDLLIEHYQSQPIDAVAAAEARGFLFAAPMALALKKPLIPLRKPGKLPYRTYSLKYELEYGTAELQVHTDGVVAGQRVLLVDDLLATGGTMQAGCQLVEKAGGQVAGCAFLVELSFLGGRQRLPRCEVFSLIKY